MKLIKIEWYKVLNYPAAWVLSAMYVLMTLITYVAVARFEMNMNGSVLSGNVCFQAPDHWKWVAYLGKFLLFIPVLLLIMLNGNEYSFRSYRQHVIEGLEPHQLHTAKLIFATQISLLCSLFVGICGLTLASIYSADHGLNLLFQQSYIIAAFFLKCMGLFSLALFISQWVRKSIVVFMVLVFYYFIEVILGLLFKYAMHLKTLSDLLPLNVFSALTPDPVKENVAAAMQGVMLDGLSQSANIGAAVFYILLFNALSYIIIRRRKW